MKQTIHKLLCMLLVLTMLCSLAPAVLADGGGDTPTTVEHDPATHTSFTYKAITGSKQHTKTCATPNCDFTAETEPCTEQIVHVVPDKHQKMCKYCGQALAKPETLVAEPLTEMTSLLAESAQIPILVLCFFYIWKRSFF